MNKTRREAISKILSSVQELHSTLEGLKDAEQEYFDNMPESFQNGDKGEAAQAAVSTLEDALSDLDSAVSNLENIE